MVGEEKLQDSELFLRLEENWDLRREVSAFSEILKNPTWILLQNLPSSSGELKTTELTQCLKKELGTQSEVRKEMTKVLACLKRTRKSKSVENFHYGKKRTDFVTCLPSKVICSDILYFAG